MSRLGLTKVLISAAGVEVAPGFGWTQAIAGQNPGDSKQGPNDHEVLALWWGRITTRNKMAAMESNDNHMDPRQGLQHNWLVISLLLLVGILLYSQAKDWLHDLYNERAEPRAVTARGTLADDEQSTIALFKSVSPSVVFITSLIAKTDSFTFRALEVPQGAGSGFVWDDHGYVVTNYHVMMNSQRAKVILADGSVRTGLLVGTAPDKDVAGLHPTTRDEDGQTVLGDIIVAIDGKVVKGTGDLLKIIDAHDVGDTLELTIQRLKEGTIHVNVHLQALP